MRRRGKPFHLLATTVLGMSLAVCSTTTVATPEARSEIPAGSTITGAGIIRRPGGAVLHCGGNLVSLRLAPGAATQRETVCDGTGGFSFVAVPPGEYYVATNVVLVVPNLFSGRGGGVRSSAPTSDV